MKNFLKIVALLALSAFPSVAEAAACFWVGGTGNINDPTHWSNTSGGTISTCAASGGWPNTTSDLATFDGASGGGTVTRNVAWTIGTLSVSGFTGTFGNSSDTAAVNLNSWSNAGSGTRTVNLGASTWTCGVAVTSVCTWSQAGATNLTFNGNTSTLVFTGSTSSSQQSSALGAFTYNVITFNADQSNGRGTAWNGGITAATLNIASPNYFSVSNATNSAITTLNITGGTSSITSLVSFVSSTFNNSFTFTLTNPASCSYCVFRDAIIATSSITATNSIDLGHNSGISFTPPSVGGSGGRIIGG